ncbi:MAG: DUF5916 domain-containing protein [Vicinamibacterales bacterium]
MDLRLLSGGGVIRLYVLVSLLTPAMAAASGPPAVRAEAAAVARDEAIVLDGKFDEAPWERAIEITGFLQRDPKEGAPPASQTVVRVVYDETYLYVAVRAFDEDPGRIVGILTRRDSDSPSDWIRVAIDSYCDRRTAYEFAVNPAGVKQDRYYFADGNSDPSWDAVWDVAVGRDDTGWTAEFRVPFSQLRFVPGATGTFGFSVTRKIGRLNETSSWPLIAKSKPGFVSQFGELRGLKLAGAARRLELAPYFVGQMRTQPVSAGNPFLKSPDPAGAVGADLKYALTPGLTLTSTLNPDFGQVEADPAVVNLTAFETFYQERRPFFVEGSGNLKFDVDCNDGNCTGLFYTRRIGRQPHGRPEAPHGGHTASPALTTILGAAKLTGRVGRFAIGALEAVTSSERASLAMNDRRWSETVEPLTNFAVVQAKREWSDQSSLGFMVTSTARRFSPDLPDLPASATTGGVNWDWRLGSQRYSITGYWAGSTVRGDSAAIDALQRNAVHNYQRPDAEHLAYDPTRTSLNGHAGMVSFQKIGGARLRFSFNGGYKTPGFDINDIGYVKRADTVQQSGWVQIRWDTPTRVYRSFRLNLNEWAGWNFGGESRFQGANVNAHVVLASNWAAGAGFNVENSGLDDRATRGGPAIRSKRGWNVWYYVQTDDRKMVHASWQGFNWADESDSSAFGFDPSITFRPTSFLSVSSGIHFEKQNEDTQWVDNLGEAPATRYVFGRIRQTTLGVTTRVNYTITPELSVQVYAQPFVSAGLYSDFKRLVRPGATNFASQFEPFAYAGEPDFNYRSFRMTNVLRWEYRPGSAIYVVWQQGREDSSSDGRFRFGRDVRSMFDLRATNVFLVKCSYWLNL